jgi:hypothetical protein
VLRNYIESRIRKGREDEESQIGEWILMLYDIGVRNFDYYWLEHFSLVGFHKDPSKKFITQT